MSVLLADVSPGTAWVTQSPDISVPEGDTVTVSCCWTLEARRFVVTWLKNGTTVKILQKVNLSGSLETSDCLNLTLTEISQEDSGSYTCRVMTEIPAYSVLEGSRTVVTVGARGGRSPPPGKKLWSGGNLEEGGASSDFPAPGAAMVSDHSLLPFRPTPPGEPGSSGALPHPEEPALPRPSPHLFLHPPCGGHRPEGITGPGAGWREGAERGGAPTGSPLKREEDSTVLLEAPELTADQKPFEVWFRLLGSTQVPLLLLCFELNKKNPKAPSFPPFNLSLEVLGSR